MHQNPNLVDLRLSAEAAAGLAAWHIGINTQDFFHLHDGFICRLQIPGGGDGGIPIHLDRACALCPSEAVLLKPISYAPSLCRYILSAPARFKVWYGVDLKNPEDGVASRRKNTCV